MNRLLSHHQSISQQMTEGFQALQDDNKASKRQVLSELGKLRADHSDISEKHVLEILNGQHDLRSSIEQSIESVACAQRMRNEETALRMVDVLSRQESATRDLIPIAVEQRVGPMIKQLENLVSEAGITTQNQYLTIHRHRNFERLVRKRSLVSAIKTTRVWRPKLRSTSNSTSGLKSYRSM